MSGQVTEFFNGMSVAKLSRFEGKYLACETALYTCLLLSKGRAMFTGNASFQWRRGEIATTLPGRPRTFGFEEPWTSLVVAMPTTMLERHHNVERWTRTAGCDVWLTSESSGDRVARSLIMSASKLQADDDPLLIDHIADGLRQRLSGWLDKEVGHPKVGDAFRVKRAMDYAEKNLHQRLTVDDLANCASLSRHHFSRVFVRSVGMPPFRYVMRKRIHRAKSLLARGAPIAEAAYLSGFTSQSHMTRVFNEQVGITPLAYQYLAQAGR